MKLPRDVSGHEAIAALRRLGFVVLRQAGSHIRLGKGEIRVTVPDHSVIAPGTLKAILRQAQVSDEEFHDAL